MTEKKDKTENGWITLPNGVHCLLDKDGNVEKGPKNLVGKNVEELSEKDGVSILHDLSPDTEGYKKLVSDFDGDHFKASHEYFKTKLQGKSVKREIEGRMCLIHITGGSWREIKKRMASDPLKSEMVMYIPEVLTEGKVNKDVSYKERKDDVRVVYSFRNVVKTSQGEKEMIVDVLDRVGVAPNPNTYNLTREGTKNYEDRIENERNKKPQTNDAGVSHLANDSGLSPMPPDDKSIISTDFEVVNIRYKDFITQGKKMRHTRGAHKPPIAFDATTKRRIDDNGFLHVESSHITKEQVAPYYGFEIPNHEKLGLDTGKIYYGYRSAEELKKAAHTFNGLPLLLHHHAESADEPQKEYRVGSVGSSAVWNAPYIDNALSITDKVGIKAVQDGSCREISAAYLYDPDFTAGEFDGKKYDFIMRNIRGNHVALVEEGRAGHDVVVADANINIHNNKKETVMEKLKNFFKGAWDSDPETKEKDELTQDDAVGKVKAIIESLADAIPPEKLEALSNALSELAQSKEDDESIDVDKKEEEPIDPVEAIDKDGDVEETQTDEPKEEDTSEDEDLPPEPSEEEKAWAMSGIESDDEAVKDAFMRGYKFGKGGDEADDEAIEDVPPPPAEEKEDDKDAVIAQDAAISRAVKSLEAKYEASAEVGCVIGAIKPMAFDSVDAIYAHALTQMGVPQSAFSDASAKDVFRIICKQREIQMANDANLNALQKFSGVFAGLNKIK